MCGEAIHGLRACSKARLSQDVFGAAESIAKYGMPASVTRAGFTSIEDLLIFDLQRGVSEQQIRWPQPPIQWAEMDHEVRGRVSFDILRFVLPALPASNVQSVSSDPRAEATLAADVVECPKCKVKFPTAHVFSHWDKCRAENDEMMDARQE